MDRTSQLPAEILDHILSFLPSDEAARMSGLSTTWKNAYDSLSFLDFGEFFIHKRIKEIVNVVDPILKHRQKQVEKFSLLLSNQWSCKVYNWINTLVDCNIKELNLGVRPRVLHSKVPDAIFNIKSIQVLKLSGFHVELPSNSTIMFSSSLRELYLDHVIFDEEFMQALCTSCCNLEVFTVEYLNGLSSFQTCLPKLKKVKVASCYSPLQLVDIRAANMQELEIYSYNYKNVLNVIIVTDCCTDLKSLCLSGVAMTQKWFDEIFTSLKNLEKLDLNSCDRLKTVKISSILLKQLRLYKCDNVIDVELNTPNLIKFVYDCPPSLPSLKLKASASLEAKIAYDSGGGRTPNHDWYLKLMKFLDNFNNSMSLELTCKNEEGLLIPRNMREHLFPPLYGINCVKVNILRHLVDCPVVDILDDVFWLSPQLDILSYSKSARKTLEFRYEDALGEDEKLCCTSQPWKCWKHKLKQVKMHNFTCLEEKQELRHYLFTNTDIMEIIEVGSECPKAKYLDYFSLY